MPAVRRDALVVALAVTTGAMDAIGFIAMGGVFASVMTGNLVLLGVSISRRNGSLAAHVGVALAAYIVGVVAGAMVAGRPDRGRPTWPARVTAALLVELALIAGLTVGWELAGGHPVGQPQLLLLGLASLAMGVQSAAVRSLAAPGLSSTYMTGTLTSLVTAVAAGDGLAGQRQNLAVIAAVVVGAIAAGVLVLEVPRAAPAVALVALSSVVVTARLAAAPIRPGDPGT
ncbi:MAG TPA: YoaK family protein [Acidimicrobiales bacterium]|nr:YoaK family protein [Acidimicrobiales bacterium]